MLVGIDEVKGIATKAKEKKAAEKLDEKNNKKEKKEKKDVLKDDDGKEVEGLKLKK